MNVNMFGLTDPGLKRTNNEDSYLLRPELKFCCVADGMGGAAAGEIASYMFVTTAEEIFSEMGTENQDDAATSVQMAFIIANRKILEHVEGHPEFKGMGTTAELLTWSGDQIIIGHVGDSRTYRLRNGILKQVTKDHSLIQEQLDQGIITKEEARIHKMRHVILRAVGVEDNISLDIIKTKAVPGDIYMLCSDGLPDMAEDQDIENSMNIGKGLEEKADRLIELAKAGGGKDNITVVLAEIG